VFAMEWHEDHFSEIYAFFGHLQQLGFCISPMICNYDDLSEEAKEWYSRWVDYYGYTEEWEKAHVEEEV